MDKIKTVKVSSRRSSKIGEEYYKRNNPRSNMFVSHNDGRYDIDTAPFKDSIAGIYAYANI